MNRRFEKIIISAYEWLVDNYEEGDKIYMFGLYCNVGENLLVSDSLNIGFSRGAYQVRALSAMIDTVCPTV